VAEPLRIEYEDFSYHIKARGNARRKILFGKGETARRTYREYVDKRYGNLSSEKTNFRHESADRRAL
jgi:hypothetical protein